MVTETIDFGEIGKNIESWNTDPDGKGTRYVVIGDTVVTFTPKDGENVRIKATNENDAAVRPEQARRVILAAYRNGQFLGMLPATAETGKIICRIPKDKYDGCELKIFFLEGGKPTQEMEIVRLYN